MQDEKAWYQSKTIWGALIAVIASLLDGFGIKLDPTAQQQAVEAFYQASAVIGALIAVYGRLTAKSIIRE